MLLPAAILVVVGGVLLAWFAGRRLPRPWNRIAVAVGLVPPAAVVAALAAGVTAGWLGCAERSLWRSPTPDGRFIVTASAIACTGADTGYNVLVEEVKADGTIGKTRAIWRSLGGPVPVAVDHAPPATFTVRAQDEAGAAVAPAEVTLEGSGLTPSRMWSFRDGTAM